MKSSILVTLGSIFALFVIGKAFAVASATTETAYDPAQQTEVTSPATAASTDEAPAYVSEQMLETLKNRRAEIEARELELAKRERALEAIEKRVEERMAALEAANEELKTRLNTVQKSADEDLVHLANMYQTMKPKQASTIFNQMDPVFAASFLRLMDSNNAGLILANMDSKKAYTISVIMANRNAEMRN